MLLTVIVGPGWKNAVGLEKDAAKRERVFERLSSLLAYALSHEARDRPFLGKLLVRECWHSEGCLFKRILRSWSAAAAPVLAERYRRALSATMHHVPSRDNWEWANVTGKPTALRIFVILGGENSSGRQSSGGGPADRPD